VGAVATIGIMLHAEPTLSMTALAGVIAAYLFYVKRDVQTPWETVRSGLVVALARWVARAVQQTKGPQYRAWRPDLLVPVTDAARLEGQFRLVEGLAHAGGSVRLVALAPPDQTDQADQPGRPEQPVRPVQAGRPPSQARQRMARELQDAVDDLRQRGLVANYAQVGAPDLITAVDESLSLLQGAIVRPNLLYVDASLTDRHSLLGLERIAEREDVGLAIYFRHPDAGLGREQRVTVWIRDQEAGFATAVGQSNLDLLLLLGMLIGRCWHDDITLATVTSAERREDAEALLKTLISEARLPPSTHSAVLIGEFERALQEAPHADLHLFGLPGQHDPETLAARGRALGASCLFVRDSSQESAFA